MKTVYATMVGDLFHRGHLEFIKKAKNLGDFLIIGVHPDSVVRLYKRKSIIPFEDRKKIIGAIRLVDLVVDDCMNIGRPSMLDNIQKYEVDIVVHGSDWVPALYVILKEKKICEVVQVEYYPLISTTEIIERIRYAKK